MNIVSHRGCWDTLSEQNTMLAIEKSFRLGFGVETDLRDLNGEVVVSHDPPTMDCEIRSLEELFSLHNSINPELFLALNIKSDGLQDLILHELQKYPNANYGLFDMSVPDLVKTKKAGLKFLSRRSELEPSAPFECDAEGYWLDEFFEDWIDLTLLKNMLQTSKIVCVVSSELHGREYTRQWEMLKEIAPFYRKNLFLCTDYPEVANSFFEH